MSVRFFLRLTLFLFFSLKSASVCICQNNSGDGINLTINKEPNDEIYISYQDSLQFVHDFIYTEESRIIEDAIKINTSLPTIITVTFKEKSIPYLVYPNEAVNIKVIKKRVCVTTGNDVVRNNELLFFSALDEKAGAVSLWGHPDVVKRIFNAKKRPTYDSIASIVETHKARQKLFLENYVLTNQITNEFRSFCDTYFNYTAVYDKLILSQLANNFDSEITQRELLNFKQFFNNDSLIIYDWYKNYLSTYSDVLTKKNENPLFKNWIDYYKFSDSMFTGKSKEFLLFYYTKNFLLENSSDEELLDKFYKNCDNQAYVDYIKNVVLPKATVPSSFNLINMDGIDNTLENAILDRGDSLVLIDFWASWCSPCHDEIISAKVLHEIYKHKKIAFLYVSVDRNRYDWKKANEEFELPAHNSFLLSKRINQTTFSNYFQIPRYALIGRDKKAITFDAPHPGDSRLKRLIDMHLK